MAHRASTSSSSDRALGADTAQVVDDDGSAGELLAAPRQGRQAVGVDEGADGQPVAGGGGEHPVEAGTVAPGRRRDIPRIDAEAVDPLRGEARHLLLQGGVVPVDDADAAEDVRGVGHGLEHVAVVRAVVAHLHQHDAVDAAGAGVAEDVLHVEGGEIGVGWIDPLGEGVGLVVVGPDVDVGVYVGHGSAFLAVTLASGWSRCNPSACCTHNRDSLHSGNRPQRSVPCLRSRRPVRVAASLPNSREPLGAVHLSHSAASTLTSCVYVVP